MTGDCIYEAAPINIHYTQLYLQYLIQTDDPGNSILMQLFYALPQGQTKVAQGEW